MLNAQGEQIGLIGVGLMGTALSERLLAGGLGVLGWDVDPPRRVALVQAGGNEASSADEVFATCRRVFLSLPDLNLVTKMLRGAAASLRPGQVIIDTTTGDPSQSEQIGAAMAEREVVYLDATVSGSSAQLRKGEVTLMVGGPESALAQCQDLFSSFARATYHVGPCGSGAKMKLVTNLVLGLNRAALAEGLSFARALKLDAAHALAVLRDSMAYSRMMDTKGDKMVAGDFEPQARLSQHLKDVRLILDAADAGGLHLPLTLAHCGLLEAAESAGYGALDNSAIIRAYAPGGTSDGP